MVFTCLCYFFLQNDPETLLRCLTMCAELLKQMSIKTRIGPTISALMSSLVNLKKTKKLNTSTSSTTVTIMFK